MIQGIHHFAIISSSEECVCFYTKLGFEVFKRIERKQDTVVLLRGHGIQIEMFVDPEHPSKSTPEPLGLRHIGFQVDNIEETACSLGLTIGPIRYNWEGMRFAHSADPDGNVVELLEPTADS